MWDAWEVAGTSGSYLPHRLSGQTAKNTVPRCAPAVDRDVTAIDLSAC